MLIPTPDVAPRAAVASRPWRIQALLLCLAAVLAAACSTAPKQRRPEAPPPAVALTPDSILGPVRGDATLELEELKTVRTHPARLRRAWIHLQQQRPRQAIECLAEVLYSTDKPSPAVEAYARYIRAEAYDKLGQPERSAFDRERARQLALDPELRLRLPADPAPAETAAPTSTAPASAAVQRRASWNPQPAVASRLDAMGRPYRITVHHSAMFFRDPSVAAAAAQIKTIQREHMNGREFGDIGYHFLIDPAGRIWEGRDLKWQGAHAEGANNVGNIGICLLGKFTRTRDGQQPPEPQVVALKLLVLDLVQRYRIGPDALYCHSDLKPTICPGPLMEPVVAQLARELRRSTAGMARVAARE